MLRLVAAALFWAAGCGGVEETDAPTPPDEGGELATLNRDGEWVCRTATLVPNPAEMGKEDGSAPSCIPAPPPPADTGVPEDATPPIPDTGDEEDCIVLDGPCIQGEGEEQEVVCYWSGDPETCISRCRLRNLPPLYTAETADLARLYAEGCGIDL